MEAGHAGLAGSFQHGLGADHVGAEEQPRVEHGQAVVGFGGEVDDGVDPLLPDGLLGLSAVADITLDEDDPVLDVGQIGSVAGIGEHVVGNNVVVGVLFDPVADEVRPDESGTSRHEKAHKAESLAASGGSVTAPRGAGGRGRQEPPLIPGNGASAGSQVDDVAGRRPSGARWRSHHQMAGVVNLGGHADHGLGGQLHPHPSSQGGAAAPQLRRHLAPARGGVEEGPAGGERVEQGVEQGDPVHRGRGPGQGGWSPPPGARASRR